jgi:transposase
MRFTNDEAVDMLAVYFECLQNAAVAKRVYAARYPNRRLCDVRVFPRLVASLRANGSFRPSFQRQRIGRTQENINYVLGYIEGNPHVSTRALSLELGISRTTVQNILKDHR